jgi:hypothetical protein
VAQTLPWRTATGAPPSHFACTVVLTLAVGVSYNAAVFSLIDAALLQPLPYAESHRIVWIS